MSELLTRYEETTKPRPATAKQIPAVTTDFFDQTGEFQTEFSTFRKKLDPTNYTSHAMEYYYTQRKNVVIPTNFVPTESGIDLGRWAPNKIYYQVGQGTT
jgi:hypothetical protein